MNHIKKPVARIVNPVESSRWKKEKEDPEKESTTDDIPSAYRVAVRKKEYNEQEGRTRNSRNVPGSDWLLVTPEERTISLNLQPDVYRRPWALGLALPLAWRPLSTRLRIFSGPLADYLPDTFGSLLKHRHECISLFIRDIFLIGAGLRSPCKRTFFPTIRVDPR